MDVCMGAQQTRLIFIYLSGFILSRPCRRWLGRNLFGCQFKFHHVCVCLAQISIFKCHHKVFAFGATSIKRTMSIFDQFCLNSLVVDSMHSFGNSVRSWIICFSRWLCMFRQRKVRRVASITSIVPASTNIHTLTHHIFPIKSTIFKMKNEQSFETILFVDVLSFNIGTTALCLISQSQISTIPIGFFAFFCSLLQFVFSYFSLNHIRIRQLRSHSNRRSNKSTKKCGSMTVLPHNVLQFMLFSAIVQIQWIPQFRFSLCFFFLFFALVRTIFFPVHLLHSISIYLPALFGAFNFLNPADGGESQSCASFYRFVVSQHRSLYTTHAHIDINPMVIDLNVDRTNKPRTHPTPESFQVKDPIFCCSKETFLFSKLSFSIHCHFTFISIIMCWSVQFILYFFWEPEQTSYAQHGMGTHTQQTRKAIKICREAEFTGFLYGYVCVFFIIQLCLLKRAISVSGISIPNRPKSIAHPPISRYKHKEVNE